MYLMVLNDGETYTNLDGCIILEVPDDAEVESIKGLSAKFTFRKGHKIIIYDEETVQLGPGSKWSVEIDI